MDKEYLESFGIAPEVAEVILEEHQKVVVQQIAVLLVANIQYHLGIYNVDHLIYREEKRIIKNQNLKKFWEKIYLKV
jgi:hypothetical protein